MIENQSAVRLLRRGEFEIGQRRIGVILLVFESAAGGMGIREIRTQMEGFRLSGDGLIGIAPALRDP